MSAAFPCGSGKASRPSDDGTANVATSEPSGGTRTFVIGGQEAHIDLRNLVDVTTAAAVAKEWFERGEDSLHGHWERK